MTTKNNPKDQHNQYQMLSDLLSATEESNKKLNQLSKQLEDIHYLLNGFTSGGASLNGYIPDTALFAYFSIVGPALARHLDKDVGLEEILKGGVHLATRMTEEHTAYRTEQQPKDFIRSSLEFLSDVPMTEE